MWGCVGLREEARASAVKLISLVRELQMLDIYIATRTLFFSAPQIPTGTPLPPPERYNRDALTVSKI